jgi:hypothetical protein
MVLVAIQPSVPGSYLPPVLVTLPLAYPPQTIISLSVHTAVCPSRTLGALVVPVAVQLSVLGLYRPPVFKKQPKKQPPPPQTIISLPVHTAVGNSLAEGALVVLVAVQLSVLGSYLPPVNVKGNPPQTIISLPVRTAVCQIRPAGALVVLVATQLSVLGSYLPPVFT